MSIDLDVEEVVGTHPCDFSTCFWNNQRKPASLGMCRLVEMRFAMYSAIATYTLKAKNDAANCPRVSETDLLTDRVVRAGAAVQIQNTPLQDSQQGLKPVAGSVNQQYKPYVGWRAKD